jgi:hypothetical protein
MAKQVGEDFGLLFSSDFGLFFSSLLSTNSLRIFDVDMKFDLGFKINSICFESKRDELSFNQWRWHWHGVMESFVDLALSGHG